MIAFGIEETDDGRVLNVFVDFCDVVGNLRKVVAAGTVEHDNDLEQRGFEGLVDEGVECLPNQRPRAVGGEDDGDLQEKVGMLDG